MVAASHRGEAEVDCHPLSTLLLTVLHTRESSSHHGEVKAAWKRNGRRWTCRFATSGSQYCNGEGAASILEQEYQEGTKRKCEGNAHGITSHYQ